MQARVLRQLPGYRWSAGIRNDERLAASRIPIARDTKDEIVAMARRAARSTLPLGPEPGAWPECRCTRSPCGRSNAGRGPRPFSSGVERHGVEAATVPVHDPPDLRGYVDLAVRGGFPEPVLRLSGATRAAWSSAYIDQIVERDAPDNGHTPDRSRLRRWIEAYASVTATVVDTATLAGAADVDRRTSGAYEDLMEALFVIDRLPALGIDAAEVMRDVSLLGRIVDSFGQPNCAPKRDCLPGGNGYTISGPKEDDGRST